MAEQPEASLVVRSGVNGVERVALDKPRHVIGRREPADIVLDNEYVSGSHAEIICYGKLDDEWMRFKQLFPANYEPRTFDKHDIQLAVVGGSVIVLTHHLTWLNVDPLGEIVDAVLEYEARK